MIAGTPRALRMELPYDYLLLWVVEKLLETLPAADRVTALQSALKPAGVSTETLVAMFLASQHGRYGRQPNSPEERTIPSERDLDALERGALQRIVCAAADGSLWTAPGFPRLLFDWGRLGGEVEMRDAVRQWSIVDANFIALIRSLRRPSMRGTDTVDLDALSGLLGLDDTVSRAKRLLKEPTVEPQARDVLRSLVDAFASTAPARSEHQARSRILSGMLQEIERSGWYPTMHWVVTTFETDRPAIDRLVEEGLIQQAFDAKYMLTIPGLQHAKANPLAARELEACGFLLTELQEAYRKEPKRKLDLEQLATQGTDVSLLRRAAFALLVYLGGVPRIQLYFAAGGELPSAVSSGDGILEVSLEEVGATDG